MKYKYLNSFALIAVVSVLATSCIKDDYPTLTTQGSTFVKILEARENQIFFSTFTDVKKVDLFSVRKDANSVAEADAATTVKLTRVDALIDEYNDENGTSFEYLPDSIYTTGIPRSGDVYDMSLASGEFAKEFTIQLDGSKWDIAHTYALAVVLSDIGGKKATTGLDTVITFISVKNKYDGSYTMTGTLTDVVVPTITAFSPWECEFHTSGPNSVVVYDPYYGDIYHAILSGPDRSVYGAFGMEITFDPVTNEVVSMTSPWAPAANTRDVLLDNSQTYFWDEATKTMDIKYYMLQPNQPIPAPYIRTTFIENYKYTGPR